MKPQKINFSELDSILAFGFGSGLIKFAPGTFGTLAAIPLLWLLSYLPDSVYLILVFSGFIFGIGICERVSKKLGSEDPSSIVWDEFIGFALAMSFAPQTLTAWVLGFLLFRLFDIAKPPPIKLIEKKYKGGLGIMLDDIVAGFFTFITLQILLKYVF